MTTPEPLWSDVRIEDYANANFDVSEYFEVVQGMTAVRDEYEVIRLMDETIAYNLREQNATLQKRIVELEAELADAKKPKPLRVVVQPDFVIDLEDDDADD